MKTPYILLFGIAFISGAQNSEAKAPKKAHGISCFAVKNLDDTNKVKIEILTTSKDSFMPKSAFFEGHEIAATITLPENPKKEESIFNITVDNKNVFRTEYVRLKNKDLYHIYQDGFTIICQP